MTMTTTTTPEPATPERIALALQGGGAIGAYQAGVLEALDAAGVDIDACCGSSIGAINAALYFGNEPARRIERLREFYHGVSVPGSALRDRLMTLFGGLGNLGNLGGSGWFGSHASRLHAEADQTYAMSVGLPGFFTRRLAVPWISGVADPALASVMDTQPLLHTLARLVDFDRLNASATRVDVMATDVATGLPHYFDSAHDSLDARMIAASGALPPWFPAVQIDGRWYWDGSLSSAAPMRRIVETAPAGTPTTILRVDLWSADGQVPDNLTDADIRQKNIEHGSRALEYRHAFAQTEHLKSLLAHALAQIDPSRRDTDPRLLEAASLAQAAPIRVLALDYEHSQRVSHTKDGQFSKAAIEHHWRHGREAAQAALARLHAPAAASSTASSAASSTASSTASSAASSAASSTAPAA